MQRTHLVLPVVLILLVACRSEPPPPIPTPVPRTPVSSSPRAITVENAEQVALLGCVEDAWQLLAFSPDSSLLAVTCQGGICLHDVRGLARIRCLDHGDAYRSAAFSPDGRILAAGAAGGKVWLWRVADGTVERVLEAAVRDFWAVAFSADGATLVASDLVPEVFVWRVADGELLRSFKGEVPPDYRRPAQRTVVALSPDGALLALKERGEVRLWRTDDGSLLRVLNGPGPDTGCLAFSADGRLLAAGSSQGIGLWAFEGGSLSPMRDMRWADGTYPLAVSPDGSLLATGSVPWTLLLRKADDGATLLSPHLEVPDRVGNLLFSPDGSLLASSGRGVTCLWGLAP